MKKILVTSTLVFAALTLIGCDNHNTSTTNNNAVAPQGTSSSAAANLSAALPQQAGANAKFRQLDFAQPNVRHWWQDTVSYQIWPRSFYDTDGDGSGDIKGIAEKLPYLKELGVGALWLTPIFKSPSYHGYDTVDYYQLDPTYGTMTDFDALIKQSNAEGIKIILDLVINHVSEQHPWFIKSVNREPGYENYFIWSKSLPATYGIPWSDVPMPKAVWHFNETRKEWYYGVFGGNQPDLNLQNPVVAAEIKKIAAFWLARGVSGFRLDAVRYLIEEGGIPHQADTKSTMAFLEDFSRFVKNQNPEAMLIGEVFADTPVVASYYDKGKGIDAAFDFSFSLNVGSTVSAQENTANTSTEQKKRYFSDLRDAFWRNLKDHTGATGPFYFYAPFVSNHDIDRITLKANNNPLSAKVAAELLLTFPGSPYLYYGEEIAMPQAAQGDDMYRRGIMQWDTSKTAGFNTTGIQWLDNSKWFPWKTDFKIWWQPYWANSSLAKQFTVAAEEQDRNSVLAMYKQLIAIRNADIVIRSPDKIALYEDTGSAWVVKYARGTDSRLIFINLDPANETVFELPDSLKGRFKNMLNNANINLDKEIKLNAAEILILVESK